MVEAREETLERSLGAIEAAKSWSPRVVAKLETLVRGGDDVELYRVNPLRFGRDRGISERESIELFVRAAKAGLFDIEWHLICPICSAVVRSFRMLRHLQSDYFCAFCNLRQETSLDDYVEVCFTVSETVRPIRFHHPETLSAMDFYVHSVFSNLARVETGKSFIDGVRPLLRVVTYLPAGASEAFRFEATPGLLHGYDHLSGAALNVPVLDETANAEQHLRVVLEGDAFMPERPTVAAGPLVLEVVNPGSGRGSLVLMGFPPLDPAADNVARYEPFLHAKDLITNQTFRDVFGEELVTGVESLKVKDLTFLFTDLKGSTALYDRIGDLTAFSLVQQHFVSMRRIVQANSGAVVKTIGDAVMAAFGRPDDAARAAAGMLAELAPGSDAGAGRDVVLKIGLHRGSAIAVTLNERLDYFGQAVNIASRVQQLADADEICLTDDVMRSDGVPEALGGLVPEREEAELKGVKGAMGVHRMRARLHAVA